MAHDDGREKEESGDAGNRFRAPSEKNQIILD
jgi:hypothetical protein